VKNELLIPQVIQTQQASSSNISIFKINKKSKTNKQNLVLKNEYIDFKSQCRFSINVIKNNKIGTQQDAQEFLLELLNELNYEIIRTQHEDRFSKEMRKYVNDSRRVRTKLEDLLSLKYVQKTVCKANHESAKTVTDLMLILNFDNNGDKSSNAINLNTLIEKFIHLEIEGFKCSKSGCKRPTIQKSINYFSTDAPSIVIVNFAR
jgi:hypothetical protein